MSQRINTELNVAALLKIIQLKIYVDDFHHSILVKIFKKNYLEG